MDAVSAWRSGRRPAVAARNDVGMVAARRAVRADGPVGVGDEAAVLRFESTASIAAGDVPWGVAGPLAARGVRVTGIEVDLAAHDLAVLVDASQGKSLVLVFRDLHRRPDQAAAVDRFLATRPDAILVEMGVPTCRPRGARAYIATHGSARVCGEAAAEVLRP
jgi:beta-N-acetylhexosaminidase